MTKHTFIKSLTKMKNKMVKKPSKQILLKL